MTEEKTSELDIHLAFQYESAIDTLLAKRLIDTDFATAEKKKFYDSLNEEKLRTSKKLGTMTRKDSTVGCRWDRICSRWSIER